MSPRTSTCTETSFFLASTPEFESSFFTAAVLRCGEGKHKRMTVTRVEAATARVRIV